MVVGSKITYTTNNPPTLIIGVGPPENGEYRQWLQPMAVSLAKTLLKVAHAGRNRSLVAHTSKCGWAIREE